MMHPNDPAPTEKGKEAPGPLQSDVGRPEPIRETATGGSAGHKPSR